MPNVYRLRMAIKSNMIILPKQKKTAALSYVDGKDKSLKHL